MSEAKKFNFIGQRTIRPDGHDKVTGKANYAADLALPGMIWGKILRSPHAHAKILKLDTSKAKAMSGVMSVATFDDLPSVSNEAIQSGEGAIDSLDLGRNDVGASGARSLGGLLGQCSSLAMLILEENNIMDARARSLTEVLGQCASLAELHLGVNRIGADAIVLLRTSLRDGARLSVWQPCSPVPKRKSARANGVSNISCAYVYRCMNLQAYPGEYRPRTQSNLS